MCRRHRNSPRCSTQPSRRRHRRSSPRSGSIRPRTLPPGRSHRRNRHSMWNQCSKSHRRRQSHQWRRPKASVRQPEAAQERRSKGKTSWIVFRRKVWKRLVERSHTQSHRLRRPLNTAKHTIERDRFPGPRPAAFAAAEAPAAIRQQPQQRSEERRPKRAALPTRTAGHTSNREPIHPAEPDAYGCPARRERQQSSRRRHTADNTLPRLTARFQHQRRRRHTGRPAAAMQAASSGKARRRAVATSQ